LFWRGSSLFGKKIFGLARGCGKWWDFYFHTAKIVDKVIRDGEFGIFGGVLHFLKRLRFMIIYEKYDVTSYLRDPVM